jgi:hypothetical protein
MLLLFRRMKISLVLLATILLVTNVKAGTWQYKWTPTAGEVAPNVEISPFKYGKTWAYSVEIDDGPSSTLTVSQPLLARYEWNDAPSGILGGINKPIVGTAAVIVGSIGRNSASLSYDQLAQLRKLGWGIVNHTYWHTGVHWDKTKMNTPEQFRRELFWSQSILAEFVSGGRATTHLVFPNGDYNYGPYLHEFGLRSGSRTSGSVVRNLFDPKLDLLNFTRNYLDAEPWKARNDALHGLPDKPVLGDFIIDFTHGMNADPESVNNKLWVERLNHIVKSWGPQGDNSMWVAPTDEIFDYFFGAKEAKVVASAGNITLQLPDSIAGTALTLKITGLNDKAILNPPVGGTLYRQGSTAWLTTPMIGEYGVPAPLPRMRRIYVGEVKNLKWDKAVSIAGVRILHDGKFAEGDVSVGIVKLDGQLETLVSLDESAARKANGRVLTTIVPDRPAVVGTELRVTSDKSLKEMEIWSLQP